MKTIAVIEDDPYIGDMLEELLHKSGYRVLRAYSGTEALLDVYKRQASQCITPEYPVMHTLTGQRNSVSCSPAPPEA